MRKITLLLTSVAAGVVLSGTAYAQQTQDDQHHHRGQHDQQSGQQTQQQGQAQGHHQQGQGQQHGNGQQGAGQQHTNPPPNNPTSPPSTRQNHDDAHHDNGQHQGGMTMHAPGQGGGYNNNPPPRAPDHVQDNHGPQNGGNNWNHNGPPNGGPPNNGQHDRRHEWREQSHSARWDDGRHNGYYLGNAWYLGPPPLSLRNDPRVYYGYRPWERGQRLNRYYLQRYRAVDWRREHLRPPRRGYRWVRDDFGDYILVAFIGGLIADVIYNDRY